METAAGLKFFNLMKSRPPFKIHSIALTKNEDDVVEHCLRKALEWSDFVYVYDGASEDRTWDIVQELAVEDGRIVPWKQDGKVFSEGLRAEVFEAFRSRASAGDWWCQLNIDEFFIDDPRAFLSGVPASEHVVWGKFAQYYITDEDLEVVDFSRPVAEVLPQLRFHEMIPTSEARFFRHRERLRWSTDWAWPAHMGVNHPRRIGIRHYPYRSPEQIQMRLDVRRDNRARGFQGWSYACDDHWKAKIRRNHGLIRDRGEGYSLPGNLEFRHMERPLHRLVKRLMHGSGIWA